MFWKNGRCFKKSRKNLYESSPWMKMSSKCFSMCVFFLNICSSIQFWHAVHTKIYLDNEWFERICAFGKVVAFDIDYSNWTFSFRDLRFWNTTVHLAVLPFFKSYYFEKKNWIFLKLFFYDWNNIFKIIWLLLFDKLNFLKVSVFFCFENIKLYNLKNVTNIQYCQNTFFH